MKKLLRDTQDKLKKYPIAYAAIGAIGIVLFWRGIWYTFDFIFLFFFNSGPAGTNYLNLADGLLSSFIGFVMLLVTGLFVSDFIGAQILSSEIRTEEKIAEKTEKEEKTEEERLDEIENKLERVTDHLDEHLENIEKKLRR